MSPNCEPIGTYNFTKSNELPKNDPVIDFFSFESSRKNNNKNSHLEIYLHLILSSGYCITICLYSQNQSTESLDIEVNY